jgi:hypothetical protein
VIKQAPLSQTNRRTRYVQVGQGWSPEGAACHERCGHRQDEAFGSVWVIAMDGTAAPQGHPKTAFGVDSHAVWRAVSFGNRYQPPPVGDCALRKVKIKGVNSSRRTVDVVEGVAVRAPVDAVRNCDAPQLSAHGKVAVETVERSLTRIIGVGNLTPYPQAPITITLPIIQSTRGSSGTKWVDRHKHGEDSRVAVVGSHVVSNRNYEPAGPSEGYASNWTWHVKGLDRTVVGIQPMQRPAQNVDPEQNLLGLRPNGPLAEKGVRFNDGFNARYGPELLSEAGGPTDFVVHPWADDLATPGALRCPT